MYGYVVAPAGVKNIIFAKIEVLYYAEIYQVTKLKLMLTLKD